MLGQNEAWYSSHPQQLLPPNDKMNSILQGLLDTSCYHPETGFIGFGSNLLVLNERQLGLHLDIHALLGELLVRAASAVLVRVAAQADWLLLMRRLDL